MHAVIIIIVHSTDGHFSKQREDRYENGAQIRFNHLRIARSAIEFQVYPKRQAYNGSKLLGCHNYIFKLLLVAT